jgi:hypothetical protein
MNDQPRADIHRIVRFAKKKHLPAVLIAKIEKLVAALQLADLGRSVEDLVVAAYEEGFRDGIADQK